jgi:hypothetical protein
MPNLDPFCARLVAFIRIMPDDAILALVRSQLDGSVVPSAPTSSTATTARRRGAAKRAKTATKPAAAKSAAGRNRTTRKPAAARANKAALLLSVEKVVRASRGVSLAEVAKATNSSKARAAAALRELKGAGRIAQGGDRRFARYAADQKTAMAASQFARHGK